MRFCIRRRSISLAPAKKKRGKRNFFPSLFFPILRPRIRICPFSLIVISIAVDGVSIVCSVVFQYQAGSEVFQAGPDIPLKPACNPRGNRYSAARCRENERKNAAAASSSNPVHGARAIIGDERRIRTDGRADGWTREWTGRTV